MKSKKKILIVDDNLDILEALEMVLHLEGFEVEQATNQDQVFAALENPHAFPNLIMMDVLLSGQDGRTIAKNLKNNDTTKKIPIIMMSAHPDVAKTIKESGADDFIPKPFKIEDLMAKIKRCMV